MWKNRKRKSDLSSYCEGRPFEGKQEVKLKLVFPKSFRNGLVPIKSLVNRILMSLFSLNAIVSELK